jgi:hypothetical protein
MENETKPDSTAIDFDSTLCKLPIHHLPAILNFLADADYALSESSEILPAESCFGRGAILGFLAQSADQLVDHVQKVEWVVGDLHQTINAGEAKGEKYTELHGHYQRLIELPEDVEPTQLIELKMTISRLEQALSLSATAALAEFKVANVTEK